ncbi:MAG: hypothetical protein ACRCTE_04590 [Cellulosilyticaceae bacterium]
MKKLLLLGIVFSLCIQSGCSMNQNNSIEVIAPLTESKYTDLEIYIESATAKGPYEPDRGIYLGAYTEDNTEMGDGMNTYEELLGVDQAFRVFQFTKENPVTDQDLLRCIADQKTPYIKVLLTDEFDSIDIYQLVGSLRSKYKTPIFIELFPITEKIKDTTEYKVAYQEAYEIIKKYLPNAVIVWSIDVQKAHESQLYYPGDSVVDWVGLNVFMPRFLNGVLYEPDISQRLDMWYKNFQEHKPMMISGLAVSHFSRYDHTYTLENTKSKLEFFYKKIPESYPRIKGILYVDVDMGQVVSGGMEDYRISSQPQLLEYMSSVLQNPYYLHKLQENTEGDVTVPMKYTVSALEYKDKSYIQLDYAKTLFRLGKVQKNYLLEDEKGQQYYDIQALFNNSQAPHNK